MGLVPGVGRRSPDRDPHSLRRIHCRHRSRDHKRLEDRLLHEQPPRQP
jgi:hypothetical protein